jgi:DNA-binding FadR family transcriptional regulator
MHTDPALSFLDRLESRTRSDEVLGALSEMVERAGLEVGDRLPPELALAAQLGVGRSTIREALNKWEGLGLIRRRRGIGTFLAAPVPRSDGPVPQMVRLEGEALLRLLEVRRALELDVVRHAAVRASAAQRAEIVRLCDALLEVIEARGDYRRHDLAFHVAIHEASGNPLFSQILLRLEEAFEKSHESPFSRAAFGLESFPIHRELCEAVAAADPDAAADAMSRIIDVVEREVRQIIESGAAAH